MPFRKDSGNTIATRNTAATISPYPEQRNHLRVNSVKIASLSARQ